MGLPRTHLLNTLALSAQCLLAFIFMTANPNAYAAHEVALLIDTSGSMIKNDPKNLRQPAIRLATQMLPADSKAGIWLFDDRARTLVNFGQVDAKWKENTIKKTTLVHSKGQWTNIESALSAAAKAFSTTADSKSILLLTDGQVDISKNPVNNQNSREKILNQILTDLLAAQIQVHSVALSKNTDQDLLQRLAIGTNGMFALAHTADELMPIFLRAFDQSIESDQVPLEGNSFSVDASIKEFTVLIFRKPGSQSSQLKTPSGTLISKQEPHNTQWYTDTLYDLVTVSTPETGEWTLDAEIDPDNRVTIVSDMELNLRGLPNNIIQGQKVTLEFFLAEDKEPIRTASLLSLLEIDFEQTILSQPPKVLRAKVTSHNQGKVRTPKDGIFSAKLSKTLINGEHQFTVSVDGKTFKRQQTKRARVFAQVMEPMVVNQPTQDDSTDYFVNLLPIKGLVDPSSLALTGSIKKPSGQIISADVTATAFGSWTIAVPPIEGNKAYKVFISVQGKTPSGEEFNLTQGPIIVDYSTPLAQLKQPTQDLFDQISDAGSEEHQAERNEVKTITEATQQEVSSPLKTKTTQASQQDPVTENQSETHPNNEKITATDETLDDETLDDETLDDETLDDETLDDEALDDEALDDENEDSKASSTLLYGAIALINIVLILGLVFFIRYWIAKKKATAEEEDKAMLAEVEKAKNQTKEKLGNQKEPKAAPAATESIDNSLTVEAAKISDMLDNIIDSDDATHQ